MTPIQATATPVVTAMQVIPVAGHDSMLLNLCGAHAPWFTRILVLLKDSDGRTGIGEVPGSNGILQALQRLQPLVIGTELARHNRTLGALRAGLLELYSLGSDFWRQPLADNALFAEQLLELLKLLHLRGTHGVHAVHTVHAIELLELAKLAHLTHLVHLVELVHVVHLVDLVKLLQRRVVVHASLDCGGCGSGCDMLLVAATRVGVVVDARVTRQLVGSAEALGAARELAGVRLFARVRPDVAGLVLEAVEGLVAQRTLVRARQIGAVFV